MKKSWWEELLEMLPAEGISGWFIHFMMNDCTNKTQKGKKNY
jgi:hypothetical protein